MRRIAAWLVIALAVGVIEAPALATRYEHIRVPQTAKLDGKLKVKVYDCESGPGWSAMIKVVIRDADGHKVKKLRTPPESDGTTRVKIRLGDRKFDPGTYSITVKCVHYFDAGGTGTYYEETAFFDIFVD